MISGAAALGLTGATIVTTTMLSPAGAAACWPSDTGSKPVPKTIPVSGEYDGGMKKFYGTGAWAAVARTRAGPLSSSWPTAPS